MDKHQVETITIEAAVARLVHLDLMPSDANRFYVTDMLEILCGHTEFEYKNAGDNTPKEHLMALKLRWFSARARLRYAKLLQKALEQEVACPGPSRIKVVDYIGGRPLLSVKSVSVWSKFYFRTYITDWKPAQMSAKKVTRWEDISINIYRDFKIGLFKGVDYSKHMFQDFDLMGRRKNSPNKIGRLLIWLSQKKPTSTFPQGVNRKDLTMLRDSLRKLTGLSGDPFSPLHETDNYKPRFMIIDDRRNADERARQRSIHVGYNDDLAHGEAPDFEREDDDAQKFIDDVE